MLYIEAPGTDPYFNLALEEYLFDTLGRSHAILMLWQNDNTVVVGRHQNTAQELNADFVRAHGIRVVRRLSGGGAVYHDLGNLNFTFIAGAEEAGLDLRLFCRPVAKALETMGVRAEITGRNDITVDGKKFSGNAQYRKRGRVMHHGTILFDSNLEMVAGALRVPEDKIESKGVSSVRSRVTNLKPYLGDRATLEDFRRALLRAVFTAGVPEPYPLSPGELEAVRPIRERYVSWEWNYGASPRSTVRRARRVEGVGRLECFLRVEGGVLADLEVRGDYFGEGAEAAARALRGARMEERDLLGALEGVELERCFHGLTAKALVGILLGEGLPDQA